MIINQSYDFLNFTSFPSSYKVETDLAGSITLSFVRLVPVAPSTKAKIECQIKTVDAVKGAPAWVEFYSIKGGQRIPGTWTRTVVIYSPNWFLSKGEVITDPKAEALEVRLVCAGSGTPGKMATTWFDDLRVYQDDMLIYSDDFSNWVPYTIPIPIIIGLGLLKFTK